MSLRNLLKTVVPIAIVIAFAGLGISQIKADRELKLENKIHLETTETKLRIKQDKLRELNEQLDSEQADKDELLKEIERLEEEVALKKQREAAEAERIAEASRRATLTQTASASAPGGSCEAEIAKYDWNQTVAMNVARAESGLRPDARGDAHLTYYQNGTRYGDSWGCFQIRYLPGRPSPSQLVNAQFNVQYAYNMYKSQGWHQPWTVCRNGMVNCN